MALKYDNCTVRVSGTKLHFTVDLSKIVGFTKYKNYILCHIPYTLFTIGKYKFGFSLFLTKGKKEFKRIPETTIQDLEKEINI